MPLKQRDLIFAALIAVIAIILFFGTRGDQAPPYPRDEVHKPFAVAIERGQQREAVEAWCVRCHNARQRPLPEQHPPKEQCLLCHDIE